jgi:3-hydroxyisobutyrate dehydrogenase-like beta-hydroxyacid dehydrogenase
VNGAIARVGYIGIGNIGEPIAANVLAAGFDLMVFDLHPEPLARMRSRGAKVAASPRELGAHAQLLEVSIAGDDAIEAALLDPNGVLAGMAPDSVIALHSTMGPPAVRRIAAAAARANVHVVDAQVSGGKAGAQAKQLCYMMGGDAAIVERCRPVFATSGSNLFHMGPLGSGASTKLSQQMMTCMHIVAVAEGARIATAAGVDVDQFFALLRVSTGQSYIADRWLDHFRHTGRDLAEGFYLGLQPALEMAHDLNVPAPGTALAQQFIRAALGHGDR